MTELSSTIRKRNNSLRWKQANREHYNALCRTQYARNLAHKRAKAKAWRAANKEKTHQYNSLKTYGLSSCEYRKMVARQNDVCAICLRPELRYRHLAIDHNHKTGRVRALLCHKCNTVLGMVNENHIILADMIHYLGVHNAE